MDHPDAVLEKAQRLEQLLQRVAAGEPLDELNEELDFDFDQRELTHQQAKYEAGEHTWKALIDGRHGHPRKSHSALREWLYARKEEDDSPRVPRLGAEIEDKFGVKLSASQVNYLLRKRGLTAPPDVLPRSHSLTRGTRQNRKPPASRSTTPGFFPRSGENGDGSGRGGRGDRADGPG